MRISPGSIDSSIPHVPGPLGGAGPADIAELRWRAAATGVNLGKVLEVTLKDVDVPSRIMTGHLGKYNPEV